MALNFNSYIGPVQFYGWHGRLKPVQYQHSPYQRIGSTGSGTQVTLARSSLSNIETWCGFNVKSQAQAYTATCESLQSFTYQVQDDGGVTYARVRVHAISAEQPKAGSG